MAIFRKAAILVPDGNATDNTTYDSLSEDQNVLNYWDDNNQIIFKITNAKFEDLFRKAKKEHKEVAFIVKNISDPLKVSARWGVFDETKVKKTENYYVLDEKMYDDHGTPKTIRIGNKDVKVNTFKMFKKDFVCAIIGSTMSNTSTLYKVYFHPGSYVFEYIRQPVIGPGGGGGGMEIPPE